MWRGTAITCRTSGETHKDQSRSRLNFGYLRTHRRHPAPRRVFVSHFWPPRCRTLAGRTDISPSHATLSRREYRLGFRSTRGLEWRTPFSIDRRLPPGQGTGRRVGETALADGGTTSEVGCQSAKQGHVHEGNPDLQRMVHTGPVGIAQQHVTHVVAQLHLRDLGVGRFDAPGPLVQVQDGLQGGPTFADQISVQQARELPGHEQAALK